MKRVGTTKVNGTTADSVFPSVDALAEFLGLSRKLTYEGLNSGRIPSIRIGKRFIVARSAIFDWLRQSGSQDRAA